MRIGTFGVHIEEGAKQRGISFEKAAKKALSFGVTNVCLAADYIDNLRDERKKYEDLGFRVSDAFGNINFITGKDVKGDSEKLIEKSLILGIDKIQITTEAYTEPQNQEQRRKEDLMVAEGLEYCAGLASRSGLKVVIEDYDVNNGPLSYQKDMKFILDHAPSVFFAFDSGNFVYADEDEVKALELMKDKLAHCHFKDRGIKKYEASEVIDSVFTSLTGKEYYPCPVGSGIIRYEEIAKILKEVRYDGVILVEHFGSPNQLLYLERSAKFVKELLSI